MKKKTMISSKKKKTTKMDIPNDVIIEIFSGLPVQTLLRFRWVCKSWFNLIRDPSFVNMQLNNNKHTFKNPLVLIYFYNIRNCNLKLKSYNIMDINDDDHHHHTTLLCPNYTSVSVKVPSVESFWCPKYILGSCNGLLCIGVRTCVLVCERYFIWNPCTKEYKMASHVLTGNSCRYNNRYGFGYDRTINDYKLVKTTMSSLCRHNGDRETCVYVYTLGTNSWKTVRSSYEEFILCSTMEDDNTNGLFISGHLYYTAMKMSSRPFDIIVSFDIAKEEYRQIAIPDIGKDTVLSARPPLKLGELNGCLCLLSCSTVFGLWEVWMMRHNVEINIDVKEEYIWEKLCTTNSAQGRSWRSLSTKLLRFCKNGKILMVEEWNYRKEIVLYDPKSGKITSLSKVSRGENVESNYMESLVSLNSGTYMM